MNCARNWTLPIRVRIVSPLRAPLPRGCGSFVLAPVRLSHLLQSESLSAGCVPMPEPSLELDGVEHTECDCALGFSVITFDDDDDQEGGT